MPGLFDDKLFTDEDLEKLFADENDPETSPEKTNEQSSSEKGQTDKDSKDSKDSDNVDQTKAFAKRLKESTTKARTEERESIAKSLGYDSYDAMMKERQRKELEEKGLDPDEAAPIIDKLVKERLDSDPRMQELTELRKQQVQEFGKKELAEITKLTNGEITRFEQLPKDVIELWKQKGSLKAAYLQLHGEELIFKARSEQSKGSTDHLAQADGGTKVETGKRLLTAAEKNMYKFFNPTMTDEELNKLTTDIKK